MNQSSNHSAKDLDFALASSGVVFRRLGLTKTALDKMRVKVILAICVTWVPLAILCWWQGQQDHMPLFTLFIKDFVQSVRFMLIIPLLIVAESQIRPWVTHVVRYFVRSGLVPNDQLDKYVSIIEKAQRVRDSLSIELFLMAIAFGTSALGFSVVHQVDFGNWQVVDGKSTLAGLWSQYVSVPIFRFAWLTWFWRVLIWCSVLFRVSRLKLNLIPTHPDTRGGLGFLAAGHSNFSILAFAMSAQVSSFMAEDILYHGHSINDLRGTILLFILILVGLSLLPLSFFTPRLIESRRLGLYQYGILAKQYVDSYHSKWVRSDHEEDEVLSIDEIQSDKQAQDSFKTVGNMNVTAFDKATVTTFAISAAAPFAPLLLTVYKFDQLLDQVLKKLL